jgi:fatty acid desaturase
MTDNPEDDRATMSDTVSARRPAASLPARPQAGDFRRAKPESNLATAAAIFAVMVAAFVALALFAAVGMGFVGGLVLAIPLGFGLLTLFHYITWGWWMSQLRDEDDS